MMGTSIMVRKTTSVTLCILLSCFLLPLAQSILGETTTYNPLEGGWVEECDGVTIVHVSGSYYEMGYQYGYLLKEKIQQNYRAVSSMSLKEIYREWDDFENYIPQEYKEELQGIADGAELPLEKVIDLNFAGPFEEDVACCGMVAYGPSTKDNKLYHLRSFDMPTHYKDPLTGIYAHENIVLVIRQPSKGYASITPSIAGDICHTAGFNEKGICIGWTTGFSGDEVSHGLPRWFKVKMVLDSSSTLNNALDIIKTSPRISWTCLVSDWKIPEARVIEQTANFSYIGSWKNETESLYPFWQIPYVIRRTNLFIDPALATLQRRHYNPSMFPFLSAVLRTNILKGTMLPGSIPWLHYQALSRGIEKYWGRLDVNSTMKMLRDVYRGKTDGRFFAVQLLRGYTSWYQWVVCPETGDLAIAFASRHKLSYRNPVHHFNFFDLLQEEPAV